MTLRYNLVTIGEQQNLTLFHNDQMYVASEQHPNWAEIKRLLLADDESVVDHFDVAASLTKKFQRITDAVTIQNGSVYFDGDPINSALSRKIVEYIENGTEDWKPFVSFLEKVMSNPSANSREQLYTFLDGNQYDILPNGNILGYKGFYVKDGSTPETPYWSTHRGHGFVNDVETVFDHLKQNVGDVVTMPRSEVVDDPNVSCSTGLHVSTYDYAKSYGQAVMAVEMDPRDVVSVPRDEWHKVRCCRYRNLGIVKVEGDRHSWKASESTGPSLNVKYVGAVNASSATHSTITWP